LPEIIVVTVNYQLEDKMIVDELISQLPLQYEYYPIQLLVMSNFEHKLNWMEKEEKDKLFKIFDKPENSMTERIRFLLDDAFDWDNLFLGYRSWKYGNRECQNCT
jgi:hypothetical protein